MRKLQSSLELFPRQHPSRTVLVKPRSDALCSLLSFNFLTYVMFPTRWLVSLANTDSSQNRRFDSFSCILESGWQRKSRKQGWILDVTALTSGQAEKTISTDSGMEKHGPPHATTRKARRSLVLRLHLNIYLYRGSGLGEGVTKYRVSLTKVTVVVIVREMELVHYGQGHRWGRECIY